MVEMGVGSVVWVGAGIVSMNGILVVGSENLVSEIKGIYTNHMHCIITYTNIGIIYIFGLSP